MTLPYPPIPRIGPWLGALALAAAATAGLAAAPLRLDQAEAGNLQREARLVVDLLQNHHYSGLSFRQIDNREMVTRFVDELDPDGSFLTADDRLFFQQRFGRTLKSVYLFRGDLQPAFEIFDTYATRVRARAAWIDARLKRGFGFTADETYHHAAQPAKPAAPRKPAEPAPANATDREWEQRLKDEVLRELVRGRSDNEAYAEVAARYARVARWAAAADSVAVRERFFDAVIRSFDPHSGYFSADTAQDFSTMMAGAVDGLGLGLSKRNGACLVDVVQPGGPADRDTDLAPGDTVLAIAEGDGPWVDAATTRLRELAAQLRGQPGTKVRLAYQVPGGTERLEVTVQRAHYVSADDHARGAISEVPDQAGKIHRIGWIDLPAFYAGGTGEEAASSAKDMRDLIERMKTASIEGLVVDLRYNPGGALPEAVAVSELFLPRGAVMFLRGHEGDIMALTAKEQPPAYTGPLVILTSARSASASEAFTGAMRLHRRAVVVGDTTTFGKGTTQAYIDLARLPGIDARVAGDWGTLRLTSAQYYLPDGSPAQQVGVKSDIVLPITNTADGETESTLPHALPAERLRPEELKPAFAPASSAVTPALLAHLQQYAGRNLTALPEWAEWKAEQAYLKEMTAKEDFSLTLEKRRAEYAAALSRVHAFSVARRQLAAQQAYPTQPLDIAAVTANHAAHDARLTALLGGGRPLTAPRLHHGSLIIPAADGSLYSHTVRALIGTPNPADAETLTPALAAALGQPVTAAQTLRAWQEIMLLEHKTDRAVLTAVNDALGGQVPEPRLRPAAEALLAGLAALDPEKGRSRPVMDIPLREALRAGAEWAATGAPPAP